MANSYDDSLIDSIKRAIRECHLEQLSQFNIIVNPLEKLTISASYNDLVQWTIESKKQIAAGVKNSKIQVCCLLLNSDSQTKIKEFMVVLRIGTHL